jgi:hypothetical protein
MVLNGQKQLRRRFVKLTFDEIGRAYHRQGRTHALARSQPQRGLDMLDREIGMTGKNPEKSAKKPAEGAARVEGERPVDQRDRRAGIFAEIRQHEGGVGADPRVVFPHLKRLPSEFAGLAAGCPRLFDPTVNDELQVAARRRGKRRPVMPIDRDRLLEHARAAIFRFFVIDERIARAHR